MSLTPPATRASEIMRFFRSPAFKLFLIGGIIIVLLIPLVLVLALVDERQQRSSSVVSEIAGSWGGTQSLAGPFLVVPYTVKVEATENGKLVISQQERRAVFLPDQLTIDGQAASKTLKRAIYEVTVYSAGVKLSGKFAPSDLATVGGNITSVRWNEAVLAFTLTNVASLKNAATLSVGTEKIALEPSIGVTFVNNPGFQIPGVHAPLVKAIGLVRQATAGDSGAPHLTLPEFTFDLPLQFDGSSELSFAPVARETVIKLASDWASPSFTGAFLPTERAISAQGFTASWTIPSLARSVPQSYELGNSTFSEFQPYPATVRFYVPVDFYDLVGRAAKYAVLFVTAAFMAVFLLELLSKARVHPVQYLFVGIAMVFFYVLLLSLAEHIGFGFAYLTASLATGGLLALYVGKSLRSLPKGLMMLAAFLILYGLLFLVLQLEDYALLAGAIAGFVILAGVMLLTLRVDWSGRAAPETKT